MPANPLRFSNCFILSNSFGRKLCLLCCVACLPRCEIEVKQRLVHAVLGKLDSVWASSFTSIQPALCCADFSWTHTLRCLDHSSTPCTHSWHTSAAAAWDACLCSAAVLRPAELLSGSDAQSAGRAPPLLRPRLLFLETAQSSAQEGICSAEWWATRIQPWSDGLW